MAKKTESNINWKQVMERARRSDNQALYGNSSGSRAVEPYTPRQKQTEQEGRFDWTAIMKTAKEQDGRGTSTPWVKTYTSGGRTALPEAEASTARGTYSPTLSRYKAQGGVTFEQYKAAVDSITQQRYRAMRGMTAGKPAYSLDTPTMGALGRYRQDTTPKEEAPAIDYGDHGSDAAMEKWQGHWADDLFKKVLAQTPTDTEGIAKRGEMLSRMQWGEDEKKAAKALLKAAQVQNLTGNAYNPSDYAPAWDAYMRGDNEEYARQVEIYDQLYARLHPKSTAFRSAAVESTGLLSMAKLGAAAAGDETGIKTLQSSEQAGKQAQAAEPGITWATKVGIGAGTALLTQGALNPAAGALAKTALGATKLGQAAISAGQTALSFAAREAIQNAGGLATGEMTGGQFAQRTLASAAGGAAGSIASGLVSSGVAKLLTDKQMMTPFKEYLRQTAASATFSAANTGVSAVASGRKMTKEEIATELGMSFAFAMVDGYLSAMRSTKAASEQVKAKYDQITQEFDAIQNHMNGRQYATQEEYEQALRDLRTHVKELKAEAGSTYYAGQQEFVNDIQKGLDVAIGNINIMLAGDTGTAAAAAGTSGVGAQTVRLLTSEIEDAFRTGAGDTPNTPVTGGNAATAASGEAFPPSGASRHLPPEGKAGAAAAANNVQRPADLPENMDVEDDIPSNMDVIDEDGDGLPDNMELEADVAEAQNGGSSDPFRRSAPPPLGHQEEALESANARQVGTENAGRTEASAPTGAQEAVGANGEPEVRTVLRQAGQEDVRGRVKGDKLLGKVGDTLREYKARLKQYDARTAELRGLEANAQQVRNNEPSPHQSPTATASPRGEAINARVRELREQLAQDEAYLEAKERDMQDVASVARARLENERQQKELGRETQTLSDKELRETEQSAQAQESAAELAARRAAEEQDAAELERIAKQREYGFAMTQYFISGYFDANDRVQMDIPTYAEAVRVAYGKGRFGWKFKREDSQRGIADEVLQEAYKEGRRKGEENGTAGIGNGGERDAGMDSDEPSGRVGRGAGGAEKESAGGFGVKESLRIQSVLGTAKAERLSPKADGIENGSEQKMFYRVPEETVQEYPALKQAKQILTDAGADDVRLVSGSIRIRTADGREMSVQGVTQGTTVWLTIDAKDGVIKTAEHEAMHLRLEAEPGLRERLIDALGLSREQRDKLARKYCEAYEGCYTGEDLSAYLDEIVCDAYAGINRMGLGADKLQSSVRAAADSTTSQSAKKPAQTRGPPEAYSVDAAYAEKLKEWAGDGMPSDASFTLGTTGDVLQGLGAIESDIYMNGEKIRTILAEHPEMTLREIERIPEILDDPVMILKSRNVGRGNQQNSRLVIFGSLKAQNGKPVLSVLDLRPNENGFVLSDMQKVTSAYTKDSNPMQYVQSSEVLFADKKRTIPLLRSLGFHMPSELQRSGSIGSISYKGRSVNLRGEKFSDVVRLDDSGRLTAKLSPETRDANAEANVAEEQNGGSSDPLRRSAPPPLGHQGEASETGEKPKVYSYDKLPGKARAFVDQAVNRTVRQAANAMSIPYNEQQRIVKPALQELMKEFLKTGKIAQNAIDRAFDKAYDEGIEVNYEFFHDFKHIRDKLLKTGIRVTPEVRAEFADLEQFRRAVRGRILLNNEGIGIDTLYGELHDEAPGLFPEAIMNPADQLMRMIEVADKIQITKQTLDEAHKGDGGDYKRWARNDFEAAVEDMKVSLRTARAWAESRERTKLAQEAPKSQAEVEELYKRQREARRAYERVQSRNLLTDEDERILDRLLRGELAPEDIQDRENARSILNVYEAKADYAALTAQIARWRRGVKEGYREQVRPLLTNSEQAKDKKGLAPGFRYDRETAERNVEDVFPEADAKRINETIFEPVHTQQAKSTRFKNDYRARVRKLDLSRKIKAGDVVSEAHAVQLYGEAMNNIEMLKKKPMDAKRDGKTLAEWEAVVRELWKTSPSLDKAKIESAVGEFRRIYDELFGQMNDVRVRNGYEPIDYRKGYFPHFQPGQTDGVLAVMGKALGIKADVTALPTTINGLTHTFKPGITWFGNAQERLGFNTAYDAVEGFDKYIEGAADIVFQTDNIQRLRAFASEVRYRTSNEGVRERVDAIRADDSISEQDKELRIKDLYENAKFELSGFAAWLDEYTNLLANKKSKLDRGVESVLGRGFYNAMNWLESRAAANMVAMNPGSWLTNFIPLTQAWGYVSTGDMVQAMGQTIAAMKNDDGFWERSAFLTNRRGSDPLVRTWQGNLSAKLSMPMERIDTFTADTIVRARYNQNLRRGMLEEDAMREADRFAANIMADRSKGATPTMFQSRNPFVKLFTQFQLEVNNQFSNIFKDLPREMRKRSLQALAWALFKMFFSAWAYNELYEKVVGRRAALDPIDMTNELVGDATGYKLNNVLDVAFGSEAGFIHEGKPAGFGNTVTNFLTSTAEELPMVGGVLGGGRVPFSSALPDVSAIWKVATNKELDSETKNAKLWEEVRDPLLYLGLPFGGGQIRKVAQGIYAVAKGGKFYRNNKGELQMQYPVFTDEGAMTVLRDVQAGVFGRNATKEARDWVESGFSKLSTKETNAYLAMSAADVKQREAWKLIQAMKDVDVPEGVSKKAAKLEALRDYDISDEAKALYYYNVIASDTERAQLDAYMDLDEELADEKVQSAINNAEATAISEEEQAAKEARAERDRASKANYAQMYRKIRDLKLDGYEPIYKSQLKALKEQEGLSDSDARKEIQKGVIAEVKEAFQSGSIDEKMATRILSKNLNESEDDTYWMLEEWKGGPDYSKYGKLTDAMEQNTDAKETVQYYLSHGVQKRDISSQITRYFKPLYKAAETRQEKNEIARQANVFYRAAGYMEKWNDMMKWDKEDS